MEESAPFISINTWFTPTVLFILLNLMIATILFISNLPNQNDTVQSKLPRSPSILHRLKSFTLYPHTSQPDPFAHHQQYLQPDTSRIEKEAPVVDEEDNNQDLRKSFGFGPTRIERESTPELDTGFVETHDEENDDLESMDEIYSKITGGNVNRTNSDTSPASGEVPLKLPAKMKKSASLKSAFPHFEEGKVVKARRPATVRERRAAAEDDDVEVDAKADDFINRFKRELKLQRLDSIVRYKNMVDRGGGK